jgi:hypothetical protein
MDGKKPEKNTGRQATGISSAELMSENCSDVDDVNQYLAS